MSRPTGGIPVGLLLFFSNNLGCIGSIAVSVIGTLLLLLLLGIVELG